MIGGGGIVAAIAGHEYMERARAILRIFWELSRSVVTLCNIWRPYHGARQNHQPRYILKYLYLAAHGKPHELAQQRKGEELARESKDHKLERKGRRHKLREAVGVTNCAGELATFRGQKCNDQNTLWEGQGMIRMPDQIRDADRSAPIDQFRLSFRLVENDSHSQKILSSTNVLSVKMPIVQMYYRVKMVLILSPTGENRAGD